MQMPDGTLLNFNTIPSKYVAQGESLRPMVFTSWKFWALGFSPALYVTKNQSLHLFAC